MKVLGLILSILVGSLSISAQSILPKEFADALHRAGMTFTVPDSLQPTAVIANHSANYQYAIKYPGRNFEIRYAVKPTDSLWAAFNQLGPLSLNERRTNPDSTYISAFQTVIINCAHGGIPRITDFEAAAVKAEFGADWGGTVIIQPRKEFAQEYKYCMIVAIHKNKAGYAFIYYLSDKDEGFNDLVLPVFHALKFNER